MRKRTVLHLKYKYVLLSLGVIIFLYTPSYYSIAHSTNIDNKILYEPLDTNYWKSNPQIGIKVVGSFDDTIWIVFERNNGFDSIVFDSITFKRSVDFRKNNFKIPVLFKSCHFDSSAYFRWAIFDTVAYFLGSEFDTTVIFNTAKYKSATYFSHSVFNSNVIFKFVQFNSIANFDSVSFKGSADFRRVKFDSAVNFSEAIFGSKAFFNWTFFGSKADFEKAQFIYGADFYNATLPDTLNLKFVDCVEGELDFTFSKRAKSSPKCLIALAGADISKIKIRMDLFKLWFPVDSSADSSYLRDYKYGRVPDSLNYDQKTAIYEQLLKKFKNDGMMESFKILDIEYRQFRANHSGWFDCYIMNNLRKWIGNYGYNKEHIIFWTLGLWLAFIIANIFWYSTLNDELYEIKFINEINRGIISNIGSTHYLISVVVYTSIIFFGIKMSISCFKQGAISNHPVLFIYLMSMYVIGLFCLGFIANFIFSLLV